MKQEKKDWTFRSRINECSITIRKSQIWQGSIYSTETQIGQPLNCHTLNSIGLPQSKFSSIYKFHPGLTGTCSRGLASSFLMVYPSRGTCSIRPLCANSRWVPGTMGWRSGRGVGPIGVGVTAWSIPARWRSRAQCQSVVDEEEERAKAM